MRGEHVVLYIFWLLTLLVGLVYISYMPRFTPVSTNAAIDQRTGKLCWTYDPIGGGDKIPLCSAK